MPVDFMPDLSEAERRRRLEYRRWLVRHYLAKGCTPRKAEDTAARKIRRKGLGVPYRG